MTHIKSPPGPPRASRWSRTIATAAACFGLAASASAQTVFSENLGVPTGTASLAAYANGQPPATFQNKGILTFSNGGQPNPADIRNTNTSTGYTGASGGGNVFFTSTNTSGAYGFSIEGINASEFSTLSLAYAYRKESATALPTFSVDYWNGTAWVTLENTSAGLFNQTATAGVNWYLAKSLTLPSGALIDGLRLRFVKTGGNSIRIDDIVLTGTYVNPTVVVSSALSGFASVQGAVSNSQSATIAGYNLTTPITLAASSGFEVSTDNATFGTTATLPVSGGSAQVRISNSAPAGALTGTLAVTSTGATAKSIALSGTVTPAASPNVTVGGTPLTPMTTFAGSPSAARTFTITGTNLTNDISVTPPTGYEVSLDGTTFSTTALTLVPVSGSASGTVSVRIPATATTSPTAGNITVNSTGIVAPITVAVSGTVTTPAFTVSLNPTSIPENSTAGSSGTVSIPAARPADLTVNLASGNTAAATVPAAVTIPAGETSAAFTVSAVANPASFLSASALITASATGVTNGTATLTVTNIDVPPLATVSLTAVGTASTQDFDSLGTTSTPNAISNIIGTHTSLGSAVASALNGWYATKIAGNGTAATPIAADIGSTVSGGVYNYGTASATDRALGMVASGSNTMAIGALIKNDSTQTLTGLRISVTAEFWRSSTSTTNTMTFGYGKIDGGTFTNTNFLNASGATAFTSLNLIGPAPVASNGALNGNDTANQQALVEISFPVTLAPGEVAFIRWQDADEAGSDAGIAIDNFSVSGLANALVTPEFDLEVGNYFTDQNVRIANFSSYTATEIRYTTDGSEPTSSSTLYVHSTGIPIIAGNGNVTLKAKAFKAADSSLTATITYVMPKDVANLTALRASAVGTTIYRVSGPITFTASTSNRNTKFFQDSGAGIHVDDNTGVVNSVYTFGDNVTGAMGRLSLFNGQLQFTPVQDFGTPVSSGNTVSPLSVTLANLTDAYQAMLVTVTGVTFETPGATIAGLPTIVNVPIKDPSLTGFTGFLRNVFPDSNVTGSLTPSGTVTLTGLVVRTSTATPVFAVGPRNLADIVATSVPSNDYAAWSNLYAPGQPSTADHDNDGVSNGLEYFMGATGSSFTANPAIIAGKITWPRNPNFVGTYSVQTSPDLVTWTNASSTLVGNSVEYTLPTGAGRLFVRMMVRIP